MNPRRVSRATDGTALGGALGLAIMATVAAGASSATGPSVRPITAVTLFIGAGLALLLPAKPKVGSVVPQPWPSPLS